MTPRHDGETRARGRFHNYPWQSIACLILASLFLGCSGGGEGDDSSPFPPCTPLSFARAITSPIPNGSVWFQEDDGGCTTLDVNVLMANMSGIWTVAFDLNYPSTIIHYDGFTAGPLLNKGSPANPPLFSVTASAPGELLVFATRVFPDPSVSASGQEVLLTLNFSKVTAGTGPIDFNFGGGSGVTEEVLDEDSNSATPVPIFSPNHGGIVTVP